MATQVRMEVSKMVSAKVHYIAKSLEVTTSYVYEMITVAYLVDHDIDEAIERLAHYTTDDPEFRPGWLSKYKQKGG